MLISSDSLVSIILASAIFLGIHLLSSTPLRATVVGRIGEQPFLGLFSLASVVLLVWMVWAYGAAPYVELWPQTIWARYLPVLIMPISLVLIVCGYATRNPTMAGTGARVLKSDNPAVGVIKVTRHPLMWGIALWALAHLPANGDAASLVFFGSLAGLALLGMRAIDAKTRARRPEAWQKLVAVTSAIPLVAITQGRNRVTMTEIGWWRIGLGLAIYVVFLLIHEWLFGVSPWPGG